MTLQKSEMPPGKMDYIRRKLDAVAGQNHVRILLAVESGSRAWGFASADSDYDVRFIYARSHDDYLSVKQLRDVIETPLVQDETLGVPMDMNGWDIRKALHLAVKSNAVFIEWLASPIRYIASDDVNEMIHFAQASANKEALQYHYDRLTRNAWEQIAADMKVKLKLYCYALRPALTLQWIRRHNRASPMDMSSLCEGLVLSKELQKSMTHLIEMKVTAQESDLISRNPVLDNFITDVLQTTVTRSTHTLDDNPVFLEEADKLFRKVITK